MFDPNVKCIRLKAVDADILIETIDSRVNMSANSATFTGQASTNSEIDKPVAHFTAPQKSGHISVTYFLCSFQNRWPCQYHELATFDIPNRNFVYFPTFWKHVFLRAHLGLFSLQLTAVSCKLNKLWVKKRTYSCVFFRCFSIGKHFTNVVSESVSVRLNAHKTARSS